MPYPLAVAGLPLVGPSTDLHTVVVPHGSRLLPEALRESGIVEVWTHRDSTLAQLAQAVAPALQCDLRARLGDAAAHGVRPEYIRFSWCVLY